jgi:hypothetical protein
LQGGARVTGVPADDEHFRHAADVALDDESGDGCGDAVLSRAQCEAHSHRQRALVGEEVLARVTGDFLAGGERGQGVDEAEEVGLERRVAHGAVHEQALPVAGLEDARRLALDTAVQLAAEALDVVLEEDAVRGINVGVFRGGVHALVQRRGLMRGGQPARHAGSFERG